MMTRKTITFVGIAGAYWIAPLLTPQTKQTPLPNPINTTVCEVLGNSQRFDAASAVVTFAPLWQRDSPASCSVASGTVPLNALFIPASGSSPS